MGAEQAGSHKWRDRFSIVLSLLATFISTASYLEMREIQQTSQRLQIDELLNEAWDMMGGAKGTEILYSNTPISRQSLELAKRDIDKALKIDENNAKALRMKGIYLDLIGNDEEAIEVHQQAIRADPEDAKTYISLGALYDNLNQASLAEELYKKALEVDPDDKGICALAYHNLAWIYRRAGKHDECVASYEKVMACDPWDADRACNLGLYYLERGQIDDAIRLFEKGVEVDPRSSDALQNLGNAFRMKGLAKDAERMYRKAMKVSPEDSTVYALLGASLLDQNQVENAERYYRRALELNASNGFAYVGLAFVALRQKGEPANIEFLAEKALEFEPDNADIRFDLGRISRWIQQPARAIAHFEEAVALRPHSWNYHMELARTLWANGSGQQALAPIRKAIELNPSHAESHLILAGIYQSLGNLTGFNEAWDRYSRLKANTTSTSSN